jgi:predicted DNA-binding transcriptional regulator YafY
MPKNKSASIRYRIIDDCINNRRKPYPSLKYLADRCSDLLFTNVSESTIEKDIAAMKKPVPFGYNAPIVYSKLNKGYVYSDNGFSISELNLQDCEWDALNFAAQLLYQYRDVPIFTNFKMAIDRINTGFSLGLNVEDPIINQTVQFERSVETKGMEWINSIFQSVLNKYAVAFTYHNIYKKEIKSYKIVPYLLKEHRNRWYLIGWSNDKNKYVTFGLDRISDLIIIEQSHHKRLDFNPDGFFQYATGIMDGADKPTEVTLIIKHPISELVLLEPLHESQSIISHKTNQIKLIVTVFINEEFYLKILGMGINCIVNKPASLRNKIKSFIEEMKANYN